MKKPTLSGTVNEHALKHEMRRVARYIMLTSPYFAPYLTDKGRKQARKLRKAMKMKGDG